MKLTFRETSLKVISAFLRLVRICLISIVVFIFLFFFLYAVKTVVGINLLDDMSIEDFLGFIFSLLQDIFK